MAKEGGQLQQTCEKHLLIDIIKSQRTVHLNQNEIIILIVTINHYFLISAYVTGGE